MTKILSGAIAATLLAAVSFAAPASAANTKTPVSVQGQTHGAQTNTDISAARRHWRGHRGHWRGRHVARRYYGPRYRYGYYGGGPYAGYRPYYRPYYAPRPFIGIGPFAFGF